MKIINKDFTLLLAGQLVSQVGDKFHMIALSLWVLKSTGSPGKMGLLLFTGLLLMLTSLISFMLYKEKRDDPKKHYFCI